MKNKKNDNILKDAINIVYNRSSDKAKEYGPFDESMASAAIIASELTGKNITTEDFYKCMIALKMSRLKYSSKEDTFLDFIAYSAALHKRVVDNEKVDTNTIQAKIVEIRDMDFDAKSYVNTKLNKTYPDDNSAEFDGNHSNN